MKELDRALAALEDEDFEDPSEPGASAWVADPRNPSKCYWPTEGVGWPAISDQAYSRWRYVVRKYEKAREREERETVPIECIVCGKDFLRQRIDQIRCPKCIAKARKLTPRDRRRRTE